MTRKWLSSVSVAALMVLVPTESAFAQDSDESEVAASRTNEIVVTGSRIARKDYASSSPIVTAGAERLESTGTPTLERALNQLPQFTASATSTETGFPNRGAQAQLNLRGLGTNRSLVLLDGRRIQPSNPDGTVDINTIPTNLISSVETITGGAASTYGSDAMSGVVNLLLKKDFQGVQLDAQGTLSSRGDARTSNISILAGTEFAEGRGHAMFSASYTNRQATPRSARSFFDNAFVTPRIPIASLVVNANPPSQDAVDSLFSTYGFPAGAVPRTSLLSINDDGTLFASPGTVAPVNYKGPTTGFYTILNNSVGIRSGSSYPLQTPLDRFNFFGNASYELTDSLELYAQGLYTTYTSDLSVSAVSYGAAGQNGSMPVTNPFIPANIQALLATRSNPTAAVPFTYAFTQFDPLNTRMDWDIYQFQLGLRGDLGGDWTWDAYGSFGDTHSVAVLENVISKSATQQLLNAADGGASLCSGGFNPFRPADQALSKQCMDFIGRSASIDSRFKQQTFEVVAQGSLFSLPAGNLKAAIGGTIRHDEYFTTPDQLYQTGDLQAQTVQLPSMGKQTVKEIFGELLIPLVHDTPLIHELNVELGYRYSDYSISGSASTYKANAEWHLTPWAQIRGGYARAIRAPSLGELFTTAQTTAVVIGLPSSTATGGDPCDVRSSYRLGANAAQVRALCLAQGVPLAAVDTYTYSSSQIFAVASGNQNLKPEKADTLSAGLVLRSPAPSGLFSNLQFSVDYYRIKITDAIGTLPYTTGLANCFNAGGANPTYDVNNINCSVASRNATGNLSNGSIPTLNLAEYRTSGVDFQTDWRIPVSSATNLRLNSVVSYLINFNLSSFQGAPSLDYSGYSSSPIASNVLPHWKGTTTATFEADDFTIGLRWRYIGETKDISKLLTPTSAAPGPGAYSYFDLFASANLWENFQIRAGVNNVFDKGPPQIGTAPSTTDIQTYDLVGTNFFLGLTTRF